MKSRCTGVIDANGIHCGATSSDLCECGKQKSTCIGVLGVDGKHCGGTNTYSCRCGKQKSHCSGITMPNGDHCGGTGTGLCDCGKRKSRCTGIVNTNGHHCGGTATSLCKCGIAKEYCIGVIDVDDVHCGGTGTSFCLCGKEKRYCSGIIDAEGTHCGGTGTSLCSCGITRRMCKIHQSMEEILHNSLFCKSCTNKMISPQRRRAGIEFCSECDGRAPKRIEHIIRPLLKDAMNGEEPTIQDDAMLGGKNCEVGHTRPDFLYLRRYDYINEKVNIVVSIEIDERGGHPDNTSECEAGKIDKEFIALKRKLGESTRIFFLRFNPDEYDGERVLLEQRIKTVADMALRLLDSEWQQYTSLVPHVFYYYYHSKCQHHIDYMIAHPYSCKVYVPTASK